MTADTAWIDTSEEAVQTFYQDRVPPHTDRYGAMLYSYQAGRSFFPIGLYFPMPCTVEEIISWAPCEGDDAGWDDGRTYVVIVNLGTEASLIPESILFAENVGTSLSVTLDRLPASTDLFYWVVPSGTGIVHAAGPLATGACPVGDPDDPNAFATLSQAGFNLAVVPGTRPGVPTHPSVMLPLRDAVPTGSYVAMALDRSADYGPNETLFAELKDDPAIYGWYLADEPLLSVLLRHGDPAEIYRELLQRYEALGVQTEQVLVVNEWGYAAEGTWIQFATLGDVASHDNYLHWDMSEGYAHIDALANSVALQTTAVAEEKPSWVVLQAFGSAEDDSPYGLRFRTPAEMRSYVYTSIIHGATGIVLFAWDSYLTRGEQGAGIVGIRPNTPPSYPESAESGEPAVEASPSTRASSVALWLSLDAAQAGLNAEIADLEPVLLSPTSTEPYRVWADTQPFGVTAPVRTILKEVGGAVYLFAVNITGAPVGARFEFAGNLSDAATLFEESAFTVSGRILEDRFAPLAAHVYRLGRPEWLDTDGDLVFDFWDNCPGVSNPGQANTDAQPRDNGPGIPGDDVTVPNDDSMGDACDPDDDNDGLADEYEAHGCGSGATEPLEFDTDGDGSLDGYECSAASDPLDSSDRPLPLLPRNTDGDLDGIPDQTEIRGWGTDAGQRDSDWDGISDCVEILSIDNDTDVTILDLQLMARMAFGHVPAGEPADSDRDGDITLLDVSFMAQRMFVPGGCPQ